MIVLIIFRSTNGLWLIENQIGRSNVVFTMKIDRPKEIAYGARTLWSLPYKIDRQMKEEERKNLSILLRIVCDIVFSSNRDYALLNKPKWLFSSDLRTNCGHCFFRSISRLTQFFHLLFLWSIKRKKWLAQLQLHLNACGSTNTNMLKPNANFTAR